jgi:hypothetical protein
VPGSEPVKSALLADATKAAGDLGVAMTPDGQDTLRSLVEDVSGRITSDAELERAHASFARLMAAAAETDAADGTRSTADEPISGPRLQRALLGLCPGFWPFC